MSRPCMFSQNVDSTSSNFDLEPDRRPRSNPVRFAGLDPEVSLDCQPSALARIQRSHGRIKGQVRACFLLYPTLRPDRVVSLAPTPTLFLTICSITARLTSIRHWFAAQNTGAFDKRCDPRKRSLSYQEPARAIGKIRDTVEVTLQALEYFLWFILERIVMYY